MDESNSTRWVELLGERNFPPDLRELLDGLGLPSNFFKFSIWYTTIDTENSGQRDQFSGLLMNPLAYMHPDGAGNRGELVLPPLGKVGLDAWKVVTKINNHHKALNPRIVFLLGFVDPESPTVHLTLHKQNPEVKEAG